MNKELTVPKISRAAIKEPRGKHKEHMLFNGLIKNIETKRVQLKKWQDAVQAFEQVRVDEYMPLLARLNRSQSEFVRRLDQVHADKIFTKKEREKLRDLICNMSEKLVTLGNDDDLSMKEIFNRHSEIDYDAIILARHRKMQETVERRLDIDLGDDVDFSTPEAFMAQVDEKITARLNAAREEAGMPPESDSERERAMKGTASARASHMESRDAQKAMEVSHSIREVYRKLASALHPDRETDPAEHERKTSLMKRVNVAYDKRDLLALLTLQLEIEQIDQHAIDALPMARLRHYNEVLREQSLELGAEIEDMEHGFRAQFGIPPFVPLTAHGILPLLRRDMKELRAAEKASARDLVEFRDLNYIKAWLKLYRIAPPAPDDDDDPFF